MQFKLDVNHRNVPSEVYLEDLRSVAARLQKGTITIKEYDAFGTYNSCSLRRRFGSWAKVLVAGGLAVEHLNEGVRREDALADLRSVAKQLRKASLTQQEYSNHGRYSSKPLVRYFGSWLKALEAAGLQPSRSYGISDEQLFANLEAVWRALGRQPKYGEVAKPLSTYSSGTYEQRFGSWRKALEAFVTYVNSTPDDVEDSAEVPQPPVLVQPPGPRRGPRSVGWRLRFLVMQRDGFRCRLCGASPAVDAKTRLQVDHITPWSRGGNTALDNLQTCCEKCNLGKGNLSLLEDTP